MPKLGHIVVISALGIWAGVLSHSHADDRTDSWLLNPPKQADDEGVGLVQKATGYVDGAQRQASESFNNFMIQVDDFFGDATASDNVVDNRSWARIRIDAKKPADEKIDIKPSLKLRVVLPQTERRFKLLFSTEEDDTDVQGDSVGRASSGPGDGNQNASFAIRFIRSARSKGKLNLDLGIRQRDSDLQFFTRLNTGINRDFGEYWTAGVSNSYYYYNKSGFEDKLSFTFRRAQFYTEELVFRSFTEFNWRKGRRGSFIGQTLGVYTQFGERKSLAFELIAGYHTSLNEGIEERFRGHEFRFRWRHNVWRPWFFYEFWPSVSWPATSDYEQSYGALLRVEMVIGQR
ncbi:MAG: hypothetical protein AB8B84_09535 [Granulosicoccus sp.]